ARSFRHWTGRPLLEGEWAPQELACRLYEARFVLVSHGTEPDPLFNYANLTAQRLWELEWDALIGMPSRKTAEKSAQDDRSRALHTALRGGFVEDYSGVRISAGGRRFRIEHGVIWNLPDGSGNLRGQAAMFSDWTRL
ncbi:MAG: MEKHLA domain-containing protein, partial [bacterium]|nr:MEKHLA domain-containing protein [bacterium]